MILYGKLILTAVFRDGTFVAARVVTPGDACSEESKQYHFLLVLSLEGNGGITMTGTD